MAIIKPEDRPIPLNVLNAQQREYDRAQNAEKDNAASLARAALDAAFENPLHAKRPQKTLRPNPGG